MKPLLILLLLCSIASHAQLTNYYETPANQVARLQRSLMIARDSLRRCESVLRDTRTQMAIAIGERESRLTALEGSANSELRREFDLRITAENSAYAYKSALVSLNQLLERDLEGKRLFGWGYYRFERKKLLPLTVIPD